MLGLDNSLHGHNGQHSSAGVGGVSGHKQRTIKDSKEIMKKRRERAICIVSDMNILSWIVFDFYLDVLWG